MWLVLFHVALLDFFASPVLANHPPKFILNGESEILLQLPEGPDTPVGSVIYSLRGEDKDDDKLTFGLQGILAQEFLEIKPTSNTDAIVILKRELDREIKDEYNFILTLTDGNLGDGNYITQSMIVLVLDVNDNEPIFKPYNTSISIREDALPGEILTVEATDRDEGPFGQVMYELQEPDGDSGKFSIQTVDSKGVISLVESLDYEKINMYQLQILAKDRPSFGRRNTGTAAILVRVIDVSDQPPEFLHVPSITRIPENLPKGSLVLQVKAVDGDRGVNNKISYSLKEVGIHKGLFTINPNSGQIIVQGNLDREAEGFNDGYVLQIEAQEVNASVYPVPATSTEVTVILMDINDQTPTFANETYIGGIIENAQVNIPVKLTSGIPEVKDLDQGKNGTFRLYLEGDDDVFDVTPNEGINEVTFLIRVKNSTLLDFETTKKFQFQIIAEEVVTVGAKSSSANVTVYVQDANDNFPQFSETEYVVSLPEDAKLGSTVATVRAHDVDSGNYGTPGIRFTQLTGQIADRLNLDSITGVITIQTNEHGFDREQVPQYFLMVEARDNNGHGNRNSVQVIVNLEDVNDNSPQFTDEKYETKLYENEIDFVTPLIIQAFDKDLNGTANAIVSYTLIEIIPTINISINDMTGEIQLNSPVDFEELPRTSDEDVRVVNVTVRASDQGNPPKYSDVVAYIYVVDVNDNIPVFDSPFYFTVIDEGAQSGKIILTVHATDLDQSSIFGNVIYRIKSGARDKFVVDANSGVITVAPGVTLEPGVYLLEVIAFDGGIGDDQRISSVLVNVTVSDINNKSPEFVDPGVIHVSEDVKIGTIITNVTAVDLDSSSKIRYSIDFSRSESRNEEGALVKFNVSEILQLDPELGTITLLKHLDREKIEKMKLLITARDVDAVNEIQTATVTLTIHVDDVNDNAPKFQRSRYFKTILENSKPETHILTVVANDPDVDRSLTYRARGNRSVLTLIHLDSLTGEISVAGKIDREEHNWLNFSVLCVDNGVPPRSNSVNVSIRVLDENDNNPIFHQSESNFSLPEDAEFGTKVGIIQATDADEGDFGKITYILDKMTSLEKFTIDPNLGILLVADKLDREVKDNYHLIIEAWDNYQHGYSNKDSRNAFTQVFIKILDVNDETPYFKTSNACTLVTEYHNIGDVVTVLEGHDLDDPKLPNSHMVFNIVDGDPNGLFEMRSVDFSKSQIVTKKSLKKQIGNFSLKIQVIDQGLPPLSSVNDVQVCVTDFNDHAPKFVKPSQNFTVKVPEDAPVGTKVIRVEAVDEDSGNNGLVQYRIKKDTGGNWKTFAISPKNGTIFLAKKLDRETQKLYQIRVEAYDLGIPTPLVSDLDLTIYVRNVNDVEPHFTIKQYQIHFTENAIPGSEKFPLPETTDDEAYDDDDKPSSVCYYLIKGNNENLFHLDKYTHLISTLQPLDREVKDEYITTVYATEDCFHEPTEIIGEHTTIQLTITVDDVNDNAPRFARKVFTGGVMTESQFGSRVMQLNAFDKDIGINARLTYFLTSAVRQRLTEGLQEAITAQPFLINKTSGELRLNFDPQKGMKGYFDFTVLVNDTGGLSDVADVYIYLLRSDQRVKFVVRLTPEELREKIDYFRDVLGNITDAIVNVDTYKYHSYPDGTIDKRKSDLYAHFVRRTDNTIMEVATVLSLIDENNEFLIALYQDLNVIESRPVEDSFLLETEDLVRAWLIGLSVFLGAVLVLVISICLAQKSKYERKLRAATATAFGSQDSGLNRVDLPNTNQHSVEGSNPIWMRSYSNDWYKDEDSLSHNSANNNSLDENALNNKSNYQTRQQIYCNNSSRSNCGDENEQMINEQNDLNRTLRRNIYESVDKSHCTVGKKLETTEL